jgi:hypothetical protein
MKIKNLSVLAVILVVLIAIIVIANQLSNKKPSEESLVFLPQFSSATCAELLVVEGKDSAKIVRKGTSWFVVPVQSKSAAAAPVSPIAQSGAQAVQPSADDEYPADSAAVETALEKLKNLKKDDLISRNPQKQAELEVDSTKGIYVEAFNDKSKSLGSLYIGKNGPNWDAHFIREKGSNDVYLASGSVRFSFFGSAQKWKNKSIVKFDKTFAKSISIAKLDSGTVELTKVAPASPKDTTVKEGWSIVKPENAKAKKDKVDDLVNTLSSLSTSEFETDRTLTPDSMGFTKPKLAISVTMQNGETKTVMVGKKKGTSGNYWAKNPENTKAVFLIQEYNFNNLNKGLKDLKDDPEAEKKAQEKAAAEAAKKSMSKSAPGKQGIPMPSIKKAAAKKK